MTRPTPLTDRPALTRQRARAAALPDPALFLQRHVAGMLDERLKEVNRPFPRQVLIAPFPQAFDDTLPGARRIADDEVLALDVGAEDLIVSALALHWSNDPVGHLVQARRALAPDGLFLCATFGGRTLAELRASLAEAETRLRGGLSPRVAPMGEIRDLGGLLQRAGFAMPVADNLSLTVDYRDPLHLMRDLRAMGEGNALFDRPRHFTGRGLMARASEIYRDTFATPEGRIPATFEIVFLTGWAPADSQPKPLRPGSATARLADALGTTETPAGDPAGPRRV